MLQDLEKQRKTEIDFINGVVLQKGKEQNIDTPFNAKVVEIVKEAEMTHTVTQFGERIRYFESLLPNHPH